ncbi:hypothetical protein EYF80_047886 [Liparis tanakae]|uniref:Uncharacterized protein n=1 Tax=Liparis tanakae TaxID=230148 RepID=A0A4Z2FL92_9TELE|nr:hypothetical protein EYF80_047886 [Liparis tanakae]
MSKVHMLRCFVNQRLTAAAQEICGLFERTLAEYEEELCSSQEENERHRKRLQAVFNPESYKQTDANVLSSGQRGAPPVFGARLLFPPAWLLTSCSGDTKAEVSSSDEAELLFSQQSGHANLTSLGLRLIFFCIYILLDCFSSGQMPFSKAISTGNVQQLLVVQVEVPPEQQVWTSSLEQEKPEPPHIKEEQEEPEPPHIKEEQEEPEPPHIKEEQEDLEPPHIKEEQEDQDDPEPQDIKEEQEGEQLQGLEEADHGTGAAINLVVEYTK